MNLLPKPLRKEEFYYASNKSIDELRKDTQTLITNSWTLIGKFSSEDEFYLYPSFQLGAFSRGFNRTFSNVSLDGIIYSESTLTCVKLSIKSSYLYIFLFFLFPSFMLLIIIVNLFSGDGVQIIYCDLLPVFIAPSVFLFLSYIMKLWLRKKVITALDLFPKE